MGSEDNVDGTATFCGRKEPIGLWALLKCNLPYGLWPIPAGTARRPAASAFGPSR